MKLLLFIALLVLSSGPAYAEWVAVGTSDDGNQTIYADPETIRRKGNLVKLWILSDARTAKTIQGKSVFSARLQEQFDCEEERYQILASSYFPQNMAQGEALFILSDESKWQPVAPGTVAGKLMNLACKK